MDGKILACAILLLAATARADGYAVIGRELSGAALKAGMKRVVVLPFSPADSSGAKAGWILAEKLTTQIVRGGGIAAVERALIANIMEERLLGRTGMLEPAAVKDIGRVSSAEGIITGSFFDLGRAVSVQARLIDVETGVIVAASEHAVEKSWLAAGALAAADEEAPDYCSGSEEVVDRIESGILDLKARYWALQMRRGVSLSGLKSFPGETISDNELRQRLYDRMNEWYGRGRVPELDAAELQRLLSLDQRASVLHHACPKRGARPELRRTS